MKTRERKQEDLNALTEELGNSKSAMIVGFNKLTVNKDQEFRNQLREAGAKYQVVKNTIARLAVKGTPYEDASEYFKGVTGIVWTENDPVVLSKTISKFIKDNADFYTLKAGIVDGRVVSQKQVEAIASLPSKEELISKLLFVINAQAQRIVTVINAVPRNLAVVIKQIGDQKPETTAAPSAEAPAAEAKADEPQAEEEVKAEETPAAEAVETAEPAAETEAAETSEAPAETAEAPSAEPEAEESAEPEAATEAAAPEATAETEQTPEEADAPEAAATEENPEQ
jgi:large subunit ribosomal protein L10